MFHGGFSWKGQRRLLSEGPSQVGQSIVRHHLSVCLGVRMEGMDCPMRSQHGRFSRSRKFCGLAENHPLHQRRLRAPWCLNQTHKWESQENMGALDCSGSEKQGVIRNMGENAHKCLLRLGLFDREMIVRRGRGAHHPQPHTQDRDTRDE